MNTHKIDQPHPTPNPDGPHTHPGASDGERAAKHAHEAASHSSSGTDEIQLGLEVPGLEPDPFLGSSPLEESAIPADPTPAAFPSDPDVNPAAAAFSLSSTSSAESPHITPRPTHDLTIPSNTPDGESPRPGTSELLAKLAFDSPDPEALSTARPARGHTHQSQAVPAEDETESSVPWAFVAVLGYATILTVALTWLLATGRLGPSRVTASISPPAKVDESSHEPVLSSPALPPVPTENIVGIGHSLRLGDLEIEPLDIVCDYVSLVRSTADAVSRREPEQSLILRLRFTNHSEVEPLAPIERAFLREQGSPLDRSVITSPGGRRFSIFDLALESEWGVAGQSFAVIQPGASAETVIASAPGIYGKIGEESTWRFRVRTAAYRSDIVGVRFRRDQIEKKPELEPEPVTVEELP